jgi:hypothetical protein
MLYYASSGLHLQLLIQLLLFDSLQSIAEEEHAVHETPVTRCKEATFMLLARVYLRICIWAKAERLSSAAAGCHAVLSVFSSRMLLLNACPADSGQSVL